jgi:glutamate-1-semialdehyde 2,1-aminomutase
MTVTTTRSDALFDRARRVMPGGVSSPVRAFGSVGGTPRFIARADGPYLWDADGNRLVDLIGSWGPMLLGHRHPRVIAALEEALAGGTSFGAPTGRETELAERIIDRAAATERVRFVNSGTEATMSALRVARGATGRSRFVKLAGHYHGHADGLLVAAGSGAATTGVPSSAGVPEAIAELTLVAPFNDLAALEALFRDHGDDIAALILEPVAGNMGLVEPDPGYHEAVRALTRRHGALLIVDEVMTGFRLARGGAVERLGLEPDLTCWGKIVGGGLPVGAYGGPAALMDHVSPLGKVYQGGTLSGNPLAMAAGIATFDAIDATPDLYATLDARGERLAEALRAGAAEARVDVRVNQLGSMLTVFFTSSPVRDFASASATDTKRFGRWFHALLARGVAWPPSAYEAAFMSYALDDALIDVVADAAREAFAAAADERGG